MVLGTEPRALHVLGDCSSMKLHISRSFPFYFLFADKVSLHCPSWPWTCSVCCSGWSWFYNPPALVSWSSEITGYTTRLTKSYLSLENWMRNFSPVLSTKTIFHLLYRKNIGVFVSGLFNHSGLPLPMLKHSRTIPQPWPSFYFSGMYFASLQPDLTSS